MNCCLAVCCLTEKNGNEKGDPHPSPAVGGRHLPLGEGKAFLFFENLKTYKQQYVFGYKKSENAPHSCLPLGEGGTPFGRDG